MLQVLLKQESHYQIALSSYAKNCITPVGVRRPLATGPAPGAAPSVVPAAPLVLQNTGKPMLVPFRCTEEDIRSAGLTCSEQDPCPVYLELAAVESTGIRIFAAGNLHAATATLYTIL